MTINTTGNTSSTANTSKQVAGTKLLKFVATMVRLQAEGFEIDANFMTSTIVVHYINNDLQLANLTIDSVMLDAYNSRQIVAIVINWLEAI